ncbi:SAM-dependent methyltransferase [Desulfogranum mediterraneum]|uniref:SAM-dependent methyltransferase n=1 Tax=Desulfogranum mediterraneum TaxID=160661 RepID=UPI00041CB208|nr:cyclopropane-fatty-acyl-phospholipid synthase family protein [Desulfogranum mediterraneum]
MTRATTTQPVLSSHDHASLLDRWARRLVFKMLGRVRSGRIILSEGERCHTFGAAGGRSVHITVHEPSVYRRVLFGGSIGAGEAYVDHHWEVDDLTGLVRIMTLNMGLVDRMEQGLAWLQRPAMLLAHLLSANSRRQARDNILAHYDLGNRMYQSFLDPTMMYSAAIYPHQEAGLPEAALHKLDLVCRKLDLRPGDRLMEIGSGWGGLAIHAARHYGCQVTTTTISDAQYREAEQRIRSQGLSERITLLRQDYRELSGRFDKVVSIEMIEAVGHRYLPLFFKKCQELLKPDGILLLQAITIQDQKYSQYLRSVDFIQRHIFPGGCLLSNQKMQQLLAEETELVVRRLDDFGFDYARTLRDWRRRFEAGFPALREQGYDESFRRLWEFYLCYCEGGFWERAISVVQLVATGPANRTVIP